MPNMAQMGMIALLASLVIFFVGLAIAYWVTIKEIEEPIIVPVSLWLSTVILVVSGATMIAARYYLRRGRIPEYRRWVVTTTCLGVAFLISQAWAWKNLVDGGVVMAANPRGSAFYVFSGLHGAHLIGGLLGLAYLVKKSRYLANDEEQPLRQCRKNAQMTAWYWNFIVISWLGLFAVLLAWAG